MTALTMGPDVAATEALPVFPFVVGCGRSGTTLLRAMLDAHPELAVPYESFFVGGMAVTPERYRQPDGGVDVVRFMDDLTGEYGRNGFGRWELPPSEVRDSLISSPPADLAAAVRRVFALYAARAGKARYADKTPIYVMRLPAVAALIPEARFVHLIRDGRDVALAWLDVEWGFASLPEAALHWATHVDAGRRAGRWLGPARYLEVRYERLVAEPEATIRDVCSFIGLGFDAQMLEYFLHAEHVVASDPHPENQQHLLQPPTPGLRDWRTQMSSDDVALFDLLAGDVLASLGY